MKFLDFVKKHTIASFAIAVGVVAIAVAGINLLVFNAKYDNYLKEYDAMQEEVNSKFAKAPEKTPPCLNPFKPNSPIIPLR